MIQILQLEKFFLKVLVAFFTVVPLNAQQEIDLTPQEGDYRSVGGSESDPNPWLTASTWEKYDGNIWEESGDFPLSGQFSGRVFIQEGSFVEYVVNNQTNGFDLDGTIIIDGNFLVNIPTNSNTQYAGDIDTFILNDGGVFRTTFGNNPQLEVRIQNLFRINGGELRYQDGNNNSALYIECKGDAEINGGLVINDTNSGLNDSGLYMSGSGTPENPQILRITSNVSTTARERFFVTSSPTSTFVKEEYAGTIEQNTVFGDIPDPRSGYVGLQNKSSNLNLVINNSSSGGVNLSRNKTINDSIFLQNGTLNYNSNTFSLGNNATIVRSAGTFASAPIFGSSVNLVYAVHDSQIESDNEIPSSNTVLNNLRIDNPLGVKATEDFQVNGEINLAAPNPTDIGLLEMTNSYDDYASLAYGSTGFNDPSNPANNLDAQTLFLGENASFVGPGTVTGKIKRVHTLASGTTYTMGSENSSIRFNSPSGTSGMPDEIQFVITRGANGEHVDNTNATLFSIDEVTGENEEGDRNAVQRLYQVNYTASTALPASTRFTLRMAYDEDELNGNTEEDLITWDHHLAYNGITPHEHGRTSNSTEDNWVELSNHSILYLAQEDVTPTDIDDEDVVKYWMISARETERDYEWLGAVNSNWNLVSNWTGGRVPDENADVFIPSEAILANSPIITDESGYGVVENDEPVFNTDEVRTRTFEIASGGVVEVDENSTKTIKLYGGPNLGGEGINYNTIANAGNFIPGLSTVEILDADGLDIETEKAVISGATTFYNLVMAENANVEMASNSEIELLNELTFNSGVDFDVLSNPNTIIFSGEDQNIVQSPSDEAFFNLKLNGSGNTTLLSGFSIHGDLTINQDIDYTNSTFSFNGESVQEIKSDSLSNLNFGNVILDAERLVTEIDTLQIQDLDLQNGNLEAGIGNLVILQGSVDRTNGFLAGEGTIEIQALEEIEDQLFENNEYQGNLVINNDVDFDLPNGFSISGDFDLREGVIDGAEKSFEFGRNLFRDNGFIQAKDSTIIKFNSSLEQSIASGFFEDNEIAIIENNGSGGPSLLDTLSVNRILKLNSGTFMSNGFLVLKASEERTAQVDQVGSNASIVGDVEVQRFVPGRRAFRFLTPSVNTSSSIRENWQEDAESWEDNPNAGFGTHITGLGSPLPESADGTNGFDWQPSGNPSIFIWSNASQSWQELDNTDETQLNVTDAYRLLIRGSRDVDLTSNFSSTSPTIIREKGELFTGSLSYNNDILGIAELLDHNNLIMISNPYQASVNLKTILSNSAGINQRFVVAWDPQLGGTENVNTPGETLGGRGAYTTVDLVENESLGDSEMNKFIQPKQAVFVFVLDPQEIDDQSPENQEEVNIQFLETNKEISEPETSVFNESSNFGLKVKLYDEISFNENNTSRDAFKIEFLEHGNNSINQNDAQKISNIDENIARLHQSGSLLSIEERAYPANGEILPIFINQYKLTSYVLDFNLKNLPSNINVYLNDQHTDEVYLLEDGTTYISFEVDPSVNKSVSYNRFYLSFEVDMFSSSDFEESKIRLYPNPISSSKSQLFLDGLDNDEAEISIYNNLGKLIHRNKKQLLTSPHQIDLGKLNLSPSLYHIKIQTESGKEFIRKFIIMD